MDFSSAVNSLSGFNDKKKYRLRWYNYIDEELSKCILEFKIKENRLNYKIRLKTEKKINEININRVFNRKNNYYKNLTNEQKVYLDLLNNILFPVLKIKYERNYYVYKKFIRMTLDYPAEYKSFEAFDNTKYFSKYYVLELKFDEKHRNLSADLLKSIPFVNKRFSKYVHGLFVTKRSTYF